LIEEMMSPAVIVLFDDVSFRRSIATEQTRLMSTIFAIVTHG